MRAVPEGRVTLRDADPGSNPLVDHRYGTDPDGHDIAVLTDALELLDRMTAEPEPAAILGKSANETDPAGPDRQLLPSTPGHRL